MPNKILNYQLFSENVHKIMTLIVMVKKNTIENKVLQTWTTLAQYCLTGRIV